MQDTVQVSSETLLTANTCIKNFLWVYSHVIFTFQILMLTLFTSCSMEEVNLYLKEARQLDAVLSARLTTYTKIETQAVRLFVSLISCILHLLKQIFYQETKEASMRIVECKDMLQQFVEDWITNNSVIGGFMFGGQVQSQGRLPKHTEKELKVCL